MFWKIYKIYKKTPASEFLFNKAAGGFLLDWWKLILHENRSSHQTCSIKKGVLRNFAKFTGKHLRQSLFFNKITGLSLQLYLKESLAQVLSCEFCQIFKGTFFIVHLWETASVRRLMNSIDKYGLNSTFHFYLLKLLSKFGDDL